MADYGLKISKPGKDVSSPTVDDYIFWSKHQSLPLIEKVSLSINITDTSCVGTETYTHNLGFFPFVIAVLNTLDGDRYILPYNVFRPAFGKAGCICPSENSGGIFEIFSQTIKENSIDIDFSVECVVPQIESCCVTVGTYIVDLYIFMFELGS